MSEKALVDGLDALWDGCGCIFIVLLLVVPVTFIVVRLLHWMWYF